MRREPFCAVLDPLEAALEAFLTVILTIIFEISNIELELSPANQARRRCIWAPVDRICREKSAGRPSGDCVGRAIKYTHLPAREAGSSAYRSSNTQPRAHSMHPTPPMRHPGDFIIAFSTQSVIYKLKISEIDIANITDI